MNPLTWPIFLFGYSVKKLGWEESKKITLQLISQIKNLELNTNTAFWASYAALLIGISTYDSIKSFANYNSATNTIHHKMNYVAKFVTISQELLGEETKLQNKKEIKSLMDLLNSSTLKSKPSFFSYKGRAISAFTLMSKLKDNFVNMLEKIGKLDAHIAIASFMQNQKNNNQKCSYCFPEYIQNDTPYVELKKYWHPFIDNSVAVTNDIKLCKDTTQNIIVTGPNAGGKSTAIKSIALSIILGQTIGIAPAKEMIFTPFKNIVTYMNIADDSGSESLFQAEMNRADELINIIKQQKNDEFIFVVMDELFTGTAPEVGVSAAYGVIKNLVNYNNMSLIFVTHFKELTELEAETNGQIKNFQVSINETNNKFRPD